MANTSPPDKQKLSAELGRAQQTLGLLIKQIQKGQGDGARWVAQLDDLNKLLAKVAEEWETSDQQQRLAGLYEVCALLGSSLNVNEVLDQVMDAIIKLTGAERGFLMLFDEHGELAVGAARNMDQETLKKDEFAISRSVIRLVAEKGDPVVTTNASEDPRFSAQESVVTHRLRSIQCVPLSVRGKILGVIYVDNRIHTAVFDEADLDMLTAFASQAAIAIENARLFTLTDEALAARVEELSMMQEIDRQLNETLDFSKVMKLTLDWAIRTTGADNGVIGLIDLERGETRIVAQHGEAPATAAAVLAGDEVLDSDSSLTVPIQREGRVIGVIALDRANDRPFSAESYAFVVRLAEHAAIAIENAQLYEAVKRANEAKSEFVSVMAHELRIPMTAIKGYTEMIGMVGGLAEQQEKFLGIIRSNIERMGVLVSDLSDISRIETGRLNLEIEEGVDIRKTLEDVLASVRAEIEKREHAVVIELPDDLPLVRADPRRLGQVLTNLVSNAYKYTPKGGTITLRAKKGKKFVECRITDTGIGMTVEEVGRLFTKFWRSEDPYVREQPGSGLGLAVARNLVELQGGQMSVESKKDAGTTFSFTIPIST